MDMAIYYKIKKIIEEDLEYSSAEIMPFSNIVTDLRMDSIDIVELTVLIENEFNILTDDNLITKIFTISDLCYAVKLQLNNKK